VSFSYKATDQEPILQWTVDQWNPHPDDAVQGYGGPVVTVYEKGDVLTIKPSYDKPIRMTKEEAIVLAENLIENYAAEVGPIVRQP